MNGAGAGEAGGCANATNPKLVISLSRLDRDLRVVCALFLGVQRLFAERLHALKRELTPQ